MAKPGVLAAFYPLCLVGLSSSATAFQVLGLEGLLSRGRVTGDRDLLVPKGRVCVCVQRKGGRMGVAQLISAGHLVAQ